VQHSRIVELRSDISTLTDTKLDYDIFDRQGDRIDSRMDWLKADIGELFNFFFGLQSHVQTFLPLQVQGMISEAMSSVLASTNSKLKKNLEEYEKKKMKEITESI